MTTASTNVERRHHIEYADYGATIAAFYYVERTHEVYYLANIIEDDIDGFDQYTVTEVNTMRVLLVTDNWNDVDLFIRECARNLETSLAS